MIHKPLRLHQLTWIMMLAVLFGGVVIVTAPVHGQAEEQTQHAAEGETGEESSESHASESDGPPLLNPTPGMYAWTLILFIALFAVLAKFVWPHILKGLQDRENKIRGDLEKAEQERKEADETLKQYKAQLAEARKEAQQLIEQSRTDAQKVAEDLKAQANEEIQNMRQRAQREIEAAKEEAVADIYDRTAELATHIAGRILEREISADDQKALVESSLSELSRVEDAEAQESVSGQA